MRLIVGNVETQAVIGGKDNLLRVNLHKELREYLRVKVDGAWKVPAFRKRQWDGYRYFITETGRFATGFLPLVARYAEELGAQIEIEDIRGDLPYLKLQPDSQVNDWKLRDYQVGLISKLDNFIKINGQDVYFPRGIIDAATNAGKTSVIAGIHQNTERIPLLYTIHNQAVYKEIVPFFKEHFEVGEINSKTYNPGNFTVAMSQTLYNRAKDSVNVRNDLSRYKVLVVDESHRGGGAEYSKLLTWINAGMRVFVSGTSLDNSNKINNMIIVGLSGPVIAKITNAELIDKGYSAQAEVFVHLNNTPSSHIYSYDDEMDTCIHQSAERAQVIAENIWENLEKQTLITFNEIAHGEFMLQHFKKRGLYNVEMTHGTDKYRDAKIQAFKDGTIKWLLASMIVKEGLNIPNIESLWMAQAGKSKITVKQILGRGLRVSPTKKSIEVHEFYDIGKYITKHSKTRIKILEEEGLKVNYLYPNKKGKPIL